MTAYLCTCGTSAAKALYRREAGFDAAWVSAQGGVEAAADVVYKTFATARMGDDQALQRELSAEIHSLARMGVTASDRVVLFSSETVDGQVCALAVKRYLERQLPGLDCRVEVIEGLQVTDAGAFRGRGVLNFTKAVLREIAASGAAQCVLNPTGGFKSLVPYTVLIGMIKGVPAKYIFERSSALIPLPMMPIEFARSRLEALRPLLERIQNESAIPRADLDDAIPFEERATLQPLFENVGRGQVSLSPVGFLVWEELEEPTALVPFLSRRAIDDLLKVRAMEGCKPEAYLARVARSCEQLAAGRHGAWSDGLFWLKPGEHTNDRYLVSVADWRLLVWRIVDHAEYDDLLRQNRGSDVWAKMFATRRTQFEPFVRMELYES